MYEYATCIQMWMLWRGLRFCTICGPENLMFWLELTCCGKVWIYRKCRWLEFLMQTKKVFCVQFVHLFKPADGPQEMPTDVLSCMRTKSLHQFRLRLTLPIHAVKNRKLTTKNTALFRKPFSGKSHRLLRLSN